MQSNNEPASKITAGGTPMCNLAEHRVSAGCTAVVALRVGRHLFVANAGDSRGVLSRAGKAIALSEDHKPQSEIEMYRITKVRETHRCMSYPYKNPHLMYVCVFVMFVGGWIRKSSG